MLGAMPRVSQVLSHLSISENLLESTINILILQGRKPRFRQDKSFVQGHIASEQWYGGMKPSNLSSNY